MNNAIYDSKGVKIAGSEVMPLVLDADIAEKLPLYNGGILYSLLDDGCISAVSMDSDAARLIIEKAEVRNVNITPEYLFRSIITGSRSIKEITALCRRFHLDFKCERQVMLLCSDGLAAKEQIELLRQVFDDDYTVITLSDEEIAVVVNDADDDELLQLANALWTTYTAELDHAVYIGIGEKISDILNLGRSYEQARATVSAGRLLSYEGGAWRYKRLLPEMLLSDVSESAMAAHSPIISRVKGAIDYEMQSILDELFRQNLNISRTAKETYMHRNTLNYKLEKLYRQTGLDVSNFDDAVTLRVILALIRIDVESKQ